MGEPTKVQELNNELLKDWKANRLVLRHMASHGKLWKGLVLDSQLELEAERLARKYKDRDPGPTEKSKYERGDPSVSMYEWQAKDWDWKAAHAVVERDVAAYKKNIAAMDARLASLHAEQARLMETDGRTKEERDAKEPPHPPWARMNAIHDEVKHLQEDAAVEKHLLKAREQDGAKLEEYRRLEQEREKAESEERFKQLLRESGGEQRVKEYEENKKRNEEFVKEMKEKHPLPSDKKGR